MNQAVQEQIEALRPFDSCRVANAIETFEVRLRNEGFVRPGLRWMTPDVPSIIGFAATSRVKTRHPPLDGRSYLDRTDWWRDLCNDTGPRIAVLEDVDEQHGPGAVAGEMHMSILKRLGCVGLVTNGCVRDLSAVEKMGFGVAALNTSPSHAYAHIIDYGLAVNICGLSIAPGDLIFADGNGVVSIPLDLLPKLPEAIRRQRAKETRIIALCASPDFTLEKLANAVKEDS